MRRAMRNSLGRRGRSRAVRRGAGRLDHSPGRHHAVRGDHEPADTDVVAAGSSTIAGTASIGEAAAVKNNTIAYVLDLSGSANDPANVDCTGDLVNDSILTCEKSAVSAVNTAAASVASPVLNSGVATFSNVGAALDVDPAGGTQLLTAPGPNIDNAIAPLAAGGGTSYKAGVTAANSVLSAPGAAAKKTMVFFSDGNDTAGGILQPSDIPAGTVVRAFAIGSGTCASGTLITMNQVAALGAPGSSCTQVTNLSVLDDVIGEQLGSTLSALQISVDGGARSPITNTTPGLPQDGPATVNFSAPVTLASGDHEVCVSANGNDALGAGEAQDCVTLQVTTVVVDCTTTCTATATDPGVAKATLQARNLPKTVGLRNVDTVPGECGGANCVTGFDVLFKDTGATGGRASLLVVTEPGITTPLRQAAIFLDGVQVTRSCISNLLTRTEVLPCKVITPLPGQRMAYFVKFAADPGGRFR